MIGAAGDDPRMERVESEVIARIVLDQVEQTRLAGVQALNRFDPNGTVVRKSPENIVGQFHLGLRTGIRLTHRIVRSNKKQA
jgi:hypothetical protein